MEKCKLVLSSSASLDSVQLNWDACCLCQIKGTDLTCPANNPVASRRNAGYRTLAENLEKILPFQNFKLESGFPLKSLIVDTDIFTSLKEKKAKWHKSCALLYQAPKVNLLIDKLKQSLAESPQGSSTKPSTSEPRKTRSTFYSLKVAGIQKLWFLFGVGAKRRIIAAHSIAERLGQDKAEALRGFHAFTGCDSVSFFASRGKRTAWSAWTDEYTQAFKTIGCHACFEENPALDASVFSQLEKFTVSMYANKKNIASVNEARQVLFCSGDKVITSIPPTQDALEQHAKRAVYQAALLWGRCDQLEQTPSSPEHWGWKRDGNAWEPCWSTRDTFWKICTELSRCGCGSNCENRTCICRRNQLPCTPSCKKCKGNCSNTRRERQWNLDIEGD